MMYRHGILTALTLLCGVCMPLSAHAYLTPDEVLNEGDFSLRFYEAPPSKRGVYDAAEAQRLRSEERRNAEQAALEKEGVAEEEEMHDATGEEDDMDDDELEALIKALQELTEGDDGALEDDDDLHGAAGDNEVDANAVEQRLLERLRNRDEAAAYQAWLNGMGETLHGGAPLSETGPATVIVTLIATLAVGETWRRVRKMEGR